MKNGRCRLHGGKSTGPRTPEGRARAARANFKHGGRSAQATLERRLARAGMSAVREMIQALKARGL